MQCSTCMSQAALPILTDSLHPDGMRNREHTSAPLLLVAGRVQRLRNHRLVRCGDARCRPRTNLN